MLVLSTMAGMRPFAVGFASVRIERGKMEKSAGSVSSLMWARGRRRINSRRVTWTGRRRPHWRKQL